MKTPTVGNPWFARIYVSSLLSNTVHTAVSDGANEQIGNLCSQWRRECCFFLCRQERYALCDIDNGAMNAPGSWQLQDNACSNVGTSANTLGGSSKRMGKLLPTFEKADPSATYPYCMINFIPGLGIRFRIANSCTGWHGVCKELSQFF